MELRLNKPWRDLTAEDVARVPGQLGVYQLGDERGAVVYIGFAGGKSLFGLRGVLQRHIDERAPVASRFRYEVNMQYMSRYKELLMLHTADHGGLPEANGRERPVHLGRLN